MTLDFAGAARMDDMLSVVTRIEAIGGASLTLAQAIERGGTVLVAATVRIALVAGGRAVRLPAGFRERLSKLATGAPSRLAVY